MTINQSINQSMRKALPTRHSRIFLAGINLLLLWTVSFGLLIPPAHAKLENGMAADVVLGQPDFTQGTSNNGGRSARSLNGPRAVCLDGQKLFMRPNEQPHPHLQHRL